MADEVVARCRGKGGNCNRPLKDPESIARLMGPVCEAREHWKRQMSHGPMAERPAPRKQKRRVRGQGGPDLLDLLAESEGEAR